MNIERAMKRIEDKRIKNEEKINLIMDEIVEM